MGLIFFDRVPRRFLRDGPNHVPRKQRLFSVFVLLPCGFHSHSTPTQLSHSTVTAQSLSPPLPCGFHSHSRPTQLSHSTVTAQSLSPPLPCGCRAHCHVTCDINGRTDLGLVWLQARTTVRTTPGSLRCSSASPCPPSTRRSSSVRVLTAVTAVTAVVVLLWVPTALTEAHTIDQSVALAVLGGGFSGRDPPTRVWV